MVDVLDLDNPNDAAYPCLESRQANVTLAIED